MAGSVEGESDGDSLFMPIAMIFGGCMFNIISTEYVLKGDANSGNLLTLAEVAMVLFQKIPGRLSKNSSVGLKPLVVPLVSHLQFTILWSSMSILSNMAFSYKISIPIFTLIRSCNMIATVLLGRLFFSQRYTWPQLICVFLVSVGIFLASMGEARALKRTSSSSSCVGCTDSASSPADSSLGKDDYTAELAIWGIGIGMLAFVQFVQGLLGHLQAGFYQRYSVEKKLAPKDEIIDEFMFTSQVVALVPFVFMRSNVGDAAWSALNSEPLLFVPFFVPSRIAWLVANSMAQSVCLKGVFRTSSIVSPLTLTIILSVRKFLSVVVSVVWFSNPWTTWHSVATVLIFGGAFAYSQAPEAEKPKSKSVAKKSD